MPGKKHILLLCLIFSAGLSGRLFWAANPSGRGQPDEMDYHGRAVALAQKGVFGEILPDGSVAYMANRPPGTSFAISLAYRLLGPDIRIGRLFTAFLGALLVLPVFFLAWRLFGTSAGLCAALLAAFHPTLVYWSGVLTSESLAALLLLAAVSCWFIEGAAGAAAAGLAWGFAALTRSTLGPAGALAGLGYLFLRGARLKNTLIFFLLFGALVLSWGFRNQAVMGKFGLDFHGGSTFAASIIYFRESRVDWGLADSTLRKAYPESAGMSMPEEDAYFMRRAVEFVKEKPGVFARQAAYNFLQFWRLYPRQDIVMAHDGRKLMMAALASEGPLLALFLAGLWFYRREAGRYWPLLVPFPVVSLVHAFSIAQMRYRLPLTPLMAVFAGAALAVILERWIKKAGAAKKAAGR